MATADRRVLREGVKGMLFLFDICFSNGLAMKKTQSEHLAARLQRKLTKHSFLTEYCNIVFSIFSLRARVAAGMPMRNPWCHTSSDMARYYQQDICNESHTLISGEWQKELSSRGMHQGTKAAQKRVRSRGECTVCKKRKQSDGSEYDGRPLHAKYLCLKCPGKKGDRWYHGDCFFTVPQHTCLLYHEPPTALQIDRDLQHENICDISIF